MRKNFPIIFIGFIYNLLSSLSLNAQALVITDTVLTSVSYMSDSSFKIKGEVSGIDSGTLKVSWAKNVVFVPIRAGRFNFSGHVKAVQPVRYEIVADYYSNSVYIEPGQINIRGGYQEGRKAGGTKENDLYNYFFDTFSPNMLSN